ncbi:hypothetical protein WMY93_019003 [Mugilogobius chulae]|uniref:Uncharacterized protein n=1 Tax=Mugilogobius chulae TaxID=88201 RepID=A0AAW0NNB8_9GOBI
MDLVCIDFLSMEPDSKGISNVLVVTAHFTRYAQAFPPKPNCPHSRQDPRREVFIHYGLPSRIIRIKVETLSPDLLRAAEILEFAISYNPISPQGDPQPERFNRTLLSMLAQMESDLSSESSDLEYVQPRRSYKTYLEQVLRQRTETSRDTPGHVTEDGQFRKNTNQILSLNQIQSLTLPQVVMKMSGQVLKPYH